MIEQETVIEAKTGSAFTLNKNKVVKVIDIEGKQVADLIAVNRKDAEEKLSTGVTIDNH